MEMTMTKIASEMTLSLMFLMLKTKNISKFFKFFIRISLVPHFKLGRQKSGRPLASKIKCAADYGKNVTRPGQISVFSVNTKS